MQIDEFNYEEVIPFTFEESEDIQEVFEPIIEKMLAEAQPTQEPLFIHTLGIPGSGKTTCVKNHKAEYPGCLVIGFNLVMEAAPQYQRDTEELGLVEAFAKWEIPARIAGYELLFRAINKGYSIFFDHGGSPELHLELMKAVKRAGYHTKMYYTKCDIEVALARVAEREKVLNRHVPPELIIKRAPMIEERAQQFRSIVDEFIDENT